MRIDVGHKNWSAMIVGLAVAGWLPGRSSGDEPASSRPKAPLTEARFEHLQKLVKPVRGEQRWRQVRWMTTLWTAQAKAAKEGKPIAVFAVGGEPLGIC